VRQVRIMLADDNPDILHYATHLLAQKFSDIEAVPDGESVLRNYETWKPDVVILDIEMGKLSGIEVAHRLLELGHQAKIVFLTVHEEQEFICGAFGAGGAAYVVKTHLNSDLLNAIEAVLAGHIFLSPTLSSLGNKLI